MGGKTIVWTFQATNKQNLTGEIWDLAKKEIFREKLNPFW